MEKKALCKCGFDSFTILKTLIVCNKCNQTYPKEAILEFWKSPKEKKQDADFYPRF